MSVGQPDPILPCVYLKFTIIYLLSHISVGTSVSLNLLLNMNTLVCKLTNPVTLPPSFSLLILKENDKLLYAIECL